MAGKASIIYPNGTKPQIGDTISGSQIGRAGRGIFTWLACPDCGLERWVAKHAVSKLCMSCAAIRRQTVGEKNPRWNGGVRQGADGYRYISVAEDHPFIKMAGKVFVHGKYRYYIAEHRLVMARSLGRPLKRWELVHHLNGIRDDNRIENLELLSHHKDHLPSMGLQRMVTDLQNRVTLLEAQVTMLCTLLVVGGDSVPDNQELWHYNTPGSCRKATEDIVHSSGNSREKADRLSNHQHQKVSPLGNQRVNWRLTRGSLNSNEHGNPELSGGLNAS